MNILLYHNSVCINLLKQVAGVIDAFFNPLLLLVSICYLMFYVPQ